MQKYLYFRTQATLADDDDIAQSAMFPASSFAGCYPTSDTALTVCFKSVNNHDGADAGSDAVVVSDTVVLTVGTNKHKEAMKAIVDAIVGNTFSKSSFISVIDDVDGTGIATGIISACGAITLADANS
tara:strand:- start:25 stop:408 length:384 start_codon:yes stop_codon:yes gene_type:complete